MVFGWSVRRSSAPGPIDGTRGRKRSNALGVVLLGAVVAAFVPVAAVHAAPAGGRSAPVEAREVRTVWTGESGLIRPLAIAYVASRNELVVTAAGDADGAKALRVGFDENVVGRLTLPRGGQPSSLAYDASRNRLTVLRGGVRVEVDAATLGQSNPSSTRVNVRSVGIRRAGGTAFDPATGDWYVLDRATGALLVTTPAGETSSVQLPTGDDAPGGPVAFNPGDGLLYYLTADGKMLHAVNRSGSIAKSFGLGAIDLRSPRAITFAPSSDNTDRRGANNLFIADRGSRNRRGGVVEVSLVNPVSRQTRAISGRADTGSLVRMTPTSAFSPGSPDPAGVAYLPQTGQLQLADSEVDETTGAGYNGVNMWTVSRGGVVQDTGTSHPAWSSEPTGLDYEQALGTLFVSDDARSRIHLDRPGGDGRFGTGDDIITFVNAGAHGSTDIEDPWYDATTGLLYQLDGASTQVYRIDPVDGVFGNGNDSVTNFDVGYLGPADFEGMTGDPARGTIYVGARTTKQIFEITKSGALVRVISLSGVTGLKYISGLEVAPASDGSGATNFYIVDRGVDNGANPSENDGKFFEVSDSGNGGQTNQAPSVNAGPNQTLTFPATSTTLNGSVTDDGLPSGSSVTQSWSVVSPSGATVVFGNPSAAVTSASFSGAGTYTLRLTASDTALTGSDDVVVTVPGNAAPLVSAGPDRSVIQPGAATLSGSASDDGLPSNSLSVTWSQISGPGAASFANASAASTTATFSATGVYVLRLTASDTVLSALDEMTVNVSTAGSASIDVPVAAGSDDAEQKPNAKANITSSDLDMTIDGTVQMAAVGLRFAGVQVPQGATITRAYVQFRSDEVGSTAANLTIRVQDADNPTTFAAVTNNITSRALLGGSVSWVPAAWPTKNVVTAAQQTPELASLVQSIVSRGGWSGGNAIVFVITGTGAGTRVADSVEGAFAPILHIEYTVG